MKLTYADKDHAYWLDGKRVKSASRVAAITADRFTVEQWGKRQIAIGMTLDQTLAERVAVDLDNRDAIQEVCDDAMRTAKSSARAQRGTQRHRVFELVLLGATGDDFITDQQRADAVVLQRTIDAYGLEPMADRVEQFIAWPDHGVVGRYDAILGYQGAPALFDLKSGVNAVKYPHSTLTQLALYLFAPHTSAHIERNGDKSTVTEWTTMPDGIDRANAYVIHCDDDHDVGELWRLDMVHGVAGMVLALQLVDWRKRHGYGAGAVSKVEPRADTSSEIRISAPSALELHHQMKAVDAAHATEAPAIPKPDEGAPVDDAAFDVLKMLYDGIAPIDKDWFKALVREATEAGVDFRSQHHKTQRRFHIYHGLIHLAHNAYNGRDELALGLVEEATNDEAVNFANVTLGHAIGSMSAAEAAVFSKLVDEYVG